MGITESVAYGDGKYFISFGIDGENQIRECFCSNPMKGSDMEAIITDGAILISLHLQTGSELEQLQRALGQDRPEGAPSGPPSSILGKIVEAALKMQGKLNSGEVR